MCQQPAYQTAITRHHHLPTAQAPATTTLVPYVWHGIRRRTPRASSFWIGFLVGTALTVTMLVWQSQRPQSMGLAQPMPMSMSDSLAITAPVNRTRQTPGGESAVDIMDRLTPTLFRHTGDYCAAPPMDIILPTMTGEAEFWHDFC